MPLKTVDEMAAELRICRRTLLEWVRLKRIPVVRVTPKLLRFDQADVMKALKAAKK